MCIAKFDKLQQAWVKAGNGVPIRRKGKSCSKALPECSDRALLGPDDHPDTGEVQQAGVDDCMEIPPSVEDIGKWDGDPFAAEMEARNGSSDLPWAWGFIWWIRRQTQATREYF